MTTVFPNYITNATVAGKADKVSSATENNFAGLDSNGNLKDSGHKHSDYVNKSAADQTINGGGETTSLKVSVSGGYAQMYANSEGGNVKVANGDNIAEFDAQPMVDAGTGAARIFVATGGDNVKQFLFKQNGNFQDGNGLTLGGLNYDKAQEHTVAIVLKGSTSTKNVSKGKYVIWDGSLYKTTAAIANGDTLSTSTNLSLISDGATNVFASNLTLKSYTGATGTSQFQSLYYGDISISSDESAYGTVIGFYVDNVGNNHPAYAQRLANGSLRVYSTSSEKSFTLQVLFSKDIVKV